MNLARGSFTVIEVPSSPDVPPTNCDLVAGPFFCPENGVERVQIRPIHRDYITILISRDNPANKKLTRTTSGVIRKESFQNPFRFNAIEVEISNLRDLAEQLTAIQEEPQALVIRGTLRDRDVNGMAIDIRKRKHDGQDGEKAEFVEDPQGHNWLMVDFDAIPTPWAINPLDDLGYTAGFLCRLLPHEFHDASYYWHWSGGAGVDGWKTLRCHLWFWLARKIKDSDLKDWAKWVNRETRDAGLVDGKMIDDALFQSVQPHFTSNPTLDRVEDPCQGNRSGFREGQISMVPLRMPPKGWDRLVWDADDLQPGSGVTQPGTRNPERWAEILGRVGDDKDGFHDPITSAIASYIATRDDPDPEFIKSMVRESVRKAMNLARRDLESDYLCDRVLDGSIRGAMQKFRKVKW